MEKTDLKYKLYCLVNYQFAGTVHAGIQAFHAGIEYSNDFGDTPEWYEFSRKTKAVVFLNGGTTNSSGIDVWGGVCIGSMQDHIEKLKNNNINYSCFFEPDINNALTSISFLVDERVWDKEKYPDPTVDELKVYYDTNINDTNINVNNVGYLFNMYYKENYGEKAAFLRTWLRGFKLI